MINLVILHMGSFQCWIRSNRLWPPFTVIKIRLCIMCNLFTLFVVPLLYCMPRRFGDYFVPFEFLIVKQRLVIQICKQATWKAGPFIVCNLHTLYVILYCISFTRGLVISMPGLISLWLNAGLRVFFHQLLCKWVIEWLSALLSKNTNHKNTV